ncbi:unnamed protein product [Lymnaea stagnalis]|uniref:Uncharacterized protein n=1 Tax=Lymnaea stagnalis TaxID=6523 RepID=A0AAV2HPT5_LYMST
MEPKSLIALAVISVLVTLCNGRKWRKSPYVDGSFFLSDHLKEQYKDLIISDTEDDVTKSWTAGQEDMNIPQVTHACPWSYVMVTNKNRIPQSHLEAQCMTHQCLNLTENNEFIPNGRPFDHEKNVSFIQSTCCSKVYYGKWVKVRSMTPYGFPKYDKRILLVAAACSCNRFLKHIY